MAKISPVSIKYMIYAKFEADGMVEKPDVIGAVFGQTEGLLGRELEMRDLQKEGKIGRIEVSLETQNGKTVGKIEIPSALDKTETTLIAAAVETIERIGPTDSKIEIERIEDVRGNKRDYILKRAKSLLEGIEDDMPKSREIASTVRTESRVSRLKEYGEEKLPAGNLDGEEIIVVEGRADVINLLKNGVQNVIGMDGNKLPESVKELSYNKELTLFVDGDRGGKLIVKNVIDNARIDYVAFAPDGKEVEELSGKEILSSLRKKIPAQEFLRSGRRMREVERDREPERDRESERDGEEISDKADIENNIDRLRDMLNSIEARKSALILNRKLEVIDRVPARGLFSSLSRLRDARVIVVDKATASIIKAAEDRNIESIVAKNFAASSSRVQLISL